MQRKRKGGWGEKKILPDLGFCITRYVARSKDTVRWFSLISFRFCAHKNLLYVTRRTRRLLFFPPRIAEREKKIAER